MGGAFIVFDGLPGCGKSTMLRRSFEYIYGKSKKYDNILVTDEPTNGPHGVSLRQFLRRQKSSADFAGEIFELFVKDRAWHIENIILPCLEKNFVILCDRYKYSSIAYQTVQGTDFNRVFAAHKDFLSPVLAVILDVDPVVAHARMNSEKSEKRKESDKFRDMEFISSLRRHFLKLPSLFPNENILIVDANKPASEVFESIRVALDKVLFPPA